MSKLTMGQRQFPTLGLRSQQPKNYVGPTLSCYLGICLCRSIFIHVRAFTIGESLIVIIFKLFANFIFELACLQLRCGCMNRIVKRLTRLKLVAKKHVYGGFINTVYHQLQYLLPGEAVKVGDTTRSGVSQTFFQRLVMSVFLRNKIICV